MMFTPRCKTSHWESAGWPVGQLTSNNCPRVLSSFFRWSWKQKFQSWYSCHLCWMMKPYTAMTRLNEAFRLAAKSRVHRRGLIHRWHKWVEAHDCRHQITSLLPYIHTASVRPAVNHCPECPGLADSILLCKSGSFFCVSLHTNKFQKKC